jgi:hypothetical protein
MNQPSEPRVILTCPTCKQRSRHPPNEMLGRWAICPHCGDEIDWRERPAIAELGRPDDDLYPLPNDNEEIDR